jgi:hypothetical protein
MKKQIQHFTWLNKGFGNIYQLNEFLVLPKIEFWISRGYLANFYCFEFSWMRFGFDIGYKFKHKVNETQSKIHRL